MLKGSLGSPYLDPAMARTYRLVTAPVQFAPPASDLVSLLRPAAGVRILDVGTGTGIVAEQIQDVVGPATRVVGVDSAIAMLAEGRRSMAYPVVVAQLSELPFETHTFDMATAGFVISHARHYEAALKEIARVCRDGARVGFTVWGSLPNPAAQLWTETATQFVPKAALTAAFHAHIPWDEWFSDATKLRQALEGAGLADCKVETRTYRMRMPTSNFLLSREASIQGAVLRERLTDDQWKRFQGQLFEAFETTFGSVVEYDRDVHFGVARTH